MKLSDIVDGIKKIFDKNQSSSRKEEEINTQGKDQLDNGAKTAEIESPYIAGAYSNNGSTESIAPIRPVGTVSSAALLVAIVSEDKVKFDELISNATARDINGVINVCGQETTILPIAMKIGNKTMVDGLIAKGATLDANALQQITPSLLDKIKNGLGIKSRNAPHIDTPPPRGSSLPQRQKSSRRP